MYFNQIADLAFLFIEDSLKIKKDLELVFRLSSDYLLCRLSKFFFCNIA